jgi:hypothetical protein
MKTAAELDIARSALRFIMLKHLIFCIALHATARDLGVSFADLSVLVHQFEDF